MLQNRILIVEDEFVVSLDLRHMLEDLGHQVVATVARGEEVLATALAQKPDMVLMDIQLAGEMKGTEAALELTSHMAVPVIFLTAYCEESVLREAEKSCPYGYLIKPFDRRELAATIRMAGVKFCSEQHCRRSELRLRLAMQAAQLSYWELEPTNDALIVQGDCSDRIDQDSNGGAEQLLGLLAEAEHGRFKRLLQHNQRFAGVFAAAQGAGAEYLEIHGQLQAQPELSGWIGVMADATDRQKKELQLRQSQAVFDTTAEAILLLDEDGCIYQANPAFSRICGYTLAQVQGRKPDEFLYDEHPLSPVTAKLHELSASHWSGEVVCRKADGSVFPVWQHICRVRSPMRRQGSRHFVVMFSDISALRRAEEHLMTLVHHDHLTGLGNRRKLEKVLLTELQRAQRNHALLGLIYLDLDGFKLVNDTLGHHVGDLLLQQIAARVQNMTRAGDVAVRVGGDEFVLVAPDIKSPDDCLSIAEKLLGAVAEEIQIGDNQVSISASIGIALYPTDAGSVADLLKCADLAMFAAKDSGRNRYAFFNPELSEKAHLRVRLERDLRLALQVGSDQLRLHYQPIFDAKTATVIGLEALMRWQHPELGWISPERFIRVAEQSNLIVELGDWLCQHTVQVMGRLIKLMPADFYLALNLSVRQFDEQHLFERLAGYFGAENLWRHLQFELTETAFMQSDKLEWTLNQLREQGASVALDDFGTGYSSLSRLKDLPLDCLKIDRSFVMHMTEDVRTRAIVESVCAVGKALGLSLVAEGVETPAQFKLLGQMGCDRIQGYLLAKPLPFEQLELFLQEHPRQ